MLLDAPRPQGLNCARMSSLSPSQMESCAGGTAMFTGLRDRLERELAEAAPHNAKVKVTSPANSLERRFSVWIGAHQSLHR